MEKEAVSAGTKYQLYAAIVRMGSGYNVGHYISYVKLTDGWWEASDGDCKRVSDNTVQNCSAYMLFYRRIAEGNGEEVDGGS